MCSSDLRHTGIKIVQQIAILLGCSVLPHLRALVEIIEGGLQDEQQKVRTITALSLAALKAAEGAHREERARGEVGRAAEGELAREDGEADAERGARRLALSERIGFRESLLEDEPGDVQTTHAGIHRR